MHSLVILLLKVPLLKSVMNLSGIKYIMFKTILFLYFHTVNASQEAGGLYKASKLYIAKTNFIHLITIVRNENALSGNSFMSIK